LSGNIYAQALEGRTPFASLHPVTVMVWTLAMVVMSFASLDLRLGLCLAALQVGVALVGRLPVRQILMVLLLVLPLTLFITVIQGLARPGEALLTVGGLSLSREGVLLGLAITVRVVNLALAMTNFFASVHPVRLAMTLTRMRLPFKYAYTTVLALRFLPLVLGDLRNIQAAQKARGYDVEQKNFAVRALKIMPLMAPLIVNVLRRASSIALAMDLRAFGAYPDRTWWEEVASPGRADLAVWILSALLLAGYLMLAFAA
jgi:energy-coupling factor transport system permease protein